MPGARFLNRPYWRGLLFILLLMPSTAKAISGNIVIIDSQLFSAGMTPMDPVGGVANDSLPALGQGINATARLTRYRALHMNLRDAKGQEIGSPSNPLSINTLATLSHATTVIDTNTVNTDWDLVLSTGSGQYGCLTVEFEGDFVNLAASFYGTVEGSSGFGSLMQGLRYDTEQRMNSFAGYSGGPYMFKFDTQNLTDFIFSVSGLDSGTVNLTANYTGHSCSDGGNVTLLTSAGTPAGWNGNALNTTQSILDASGAVHTVGYSIGAGSVPVSILNLPPGAATSARQPALGTAGSPASDVLTIQGAPGMTAVKTDGSATTQPVSAVSLPLPAGAATSANQSTEIGSLASIATNTTGASTSANQTTANTTLSAISGNQTSGAQKTQVTSVASSSSTNLTTSYQAPGSTYTVHLDGSVTVSNPITGYALEAGHLANIDTNTTGLATAANQTTGNSSLSTIATNTAGLATAANQATAATTLTTIATNTGHITDGTAKTTILGAVVVTLSTGPATGTIGSVSPSSATVAGFKDGSGNLQAALVDSNGYLRVNLSSAGVTVPVSESSSTSKVTIYTDGTSTPTFNMGGAIPAGANTVGGVTTSSPTAKITAYFDQTSTAPANVSQFGGSAVSLGQKTMANSMPFTLASDQPPIVFQSTASTTGGATYFHFISTAGTVGYVINIKASAGTIYSYNCVNSSGTIAYTRLFDKATNPIPGTDTPALTWGIPANGTTGAGNNPQFPPMGGALLNGIGFDVTGAVPDNDRTAVSANQIVCSGWYK